ncbi:hypothetical protein EVA_08115 [gut metagenome]|uniref:Uncharacterized protein n=1 Tax=gut metagenome TaxID=749906 RepID=J9CU81_9ZZZZ
MISRDSELTNRSSFGPIPLTPITQRTTTRPGSSQRARLGHISISLKLRKSISAFRI